MLATRLLFVIAGRRGLSGQAGAVSIAAAGCRVVHGGSAALAAQVIAANPRLALRHALAGTAPASLTLSADLAPPGPAVVLLGRIRLQPRLHAALHPQPRMQTQTLRALPRLLAHTGTLPCL